jgi:2-polyprenyl-3-methyl-5-hydroxy-6-metoxy-1,4-benzoquinol methylase
MPEALEATLRRLQEERAEADRKYNDALTALDRALKPEPEFPAAPPAYDEHQITPLNESWNILPAPPQTSGLTGRLTGIIWRTVGPFLQRQLTFNSRLVDHINRNVAAHREANRSTEALIALLRQQLAHQAELQARLLYLLQQITPYVDTKDRDAAGGALVLNAALSAVGENMAKRWESMAVRDQRYDARLAAIAAAQDDLRVALTVSQQALHTMKRRIEATVVPAAAASTAPAGSNTGLTGEAFGSPLDAYKYVGFEDQFRGTRDEIRRRLESYLPLFEGHADVLDVGCGRGEFLDLLASRGIVARGIDLNEEMVEVCKARGLSVVHADAVGYLSTLEDSSLGGIFAAQVVEHLQPSYLLRFLDLGFQKLAPGGRVVLETLNPACWVAFFESYIRDITHVWPLHPETLQYLVLASGFTTARIEYRSPVPEQDRLQQVAVPSDADPHVADMAETVNANVEKLNARLFTHLDYAVVGEKAASPR